MAQLSIEEAADAIAGSMTDWSQGGMRKDWPNKNHIALAECYVSTKRFVDSMMEIVSKATDTFLAQQLVTKMAGLGTLDDPKDFEAYAQSMIQSLRQAEQQKAE